MLLFFVTAIGKVLPPGIATATGEIIKYKIDGKNIDYGKLISDVAFDLVWENTLGKLFPTSTKAKKKICEYKTLCLYLFMNYYNVTFS